MSSGKIVQIIGAVIDVEFPREEVPKVYDALLVTERGLTLEVQQQLGDGVVRTIAMGSSEGLARGLSVTNTGQPIAVPVGEETLGHGDGSTPASASQSTGIRRRSRIRKVTSNCSRRA